jgi:hypothetical protein
LADDKQIGQGRRARTAATLLSRRNDPLHKTRETFAGNNYGLFAMDGNIQRFINWSVHAAAGKKPDCFQPAKIL